MVKVKFAPFIEHVLREHSIDDNLVFVMHGAIIIRMLPLILGNIDPQFAITQSRGQTNGQYILAETTSKGLMCPSWFGLAVKTNSQT